MNKQLLFIAVLVHMAQLLRPKQKKENKRAAESDPSGHCRLQDKMSLYCLTSGGFALNAAAKRQHEGE